MILHPGPPTDAVGGPIFALRGQISARFSGIRCAAAVSGLKVLVTSVEMAEEEPDDVMKARIVGFRGKDVDEIEIYDDIEL